MILIRGERLFFMDGNVCLHNPNVNNWIDELKIERTVRQQEWIPIKHEWLPYKDVLLYEVSQFLQLGHRRDKVIRYKDVKVRHYYIKGIHFKIKLNLRLIYLKHNKGYVLHSLKSSLQ